MTLLSSRHLALALPHPAKGDGCGSGPREAGFPPEAVRREEVAGNEVRRRDLWGERD